MALDIKVVKDSTAADGSKITVKDITGAYDVNSNPTGYGTPNPDRDTLVLFLRPFQKRYEGGEEIIDTLMIITPSNSDPTVVDTWDVALDKSCWMQIKVYGLQLYASPSSVSFDIGEITYDVASSEFRRILTKSGSGTFTYTYQVESISILDNDSYKKKYVSTYNTLIIPELCDCANSVNEKYFTSKEKDEAVFRQYLEITGAIVSIRNDFGFGNFSEGLKTIEFVENICGCVNDNCNC